MYIWLRKKGITPNCSMICSEKQNQTSKSSTSQQNLQVKKSSPTVNLHFSSIFSRLEEAGVQGIHGNPIPFFTCPQPEAKASHPPWFTRGQGLRFTLHLYRFVDTPRLTDSWRRRRRRGICTREVFFWVGFLGISRCKWSYKWEGEECFKIGIPRFWTKMVWSNCWKIVRSQMLKERQE